MNTLVVSYLIFVLTAIHSTSGSDDWSIDRPKILNYIQDLHKTNREQDENFKNQIDDLKNEQNVVNAKHTDEIQRLEKALDEKQKIIDELKANDTKKGIELSAMKIQLENMAIQGMKISL